MKSRLRAWVRQRPRDIAQRGKRKSPWVVYWNDPDGIRREQTCGVGRDGWLQAEKEKVRIHEQLLEGKSAVPTEVRWCDFRDAFEENTLSRRAASTKGVVRTAMAHFERIVNPSKMTGISTRSIDAYCATRLKEPGKRTGDTVSPATVNKELRHLKTILRKANQWGYLPLLPSFAFEREPERAVPSVST